MNSRLRTFVFAGLTISVITLAPTPLPAEPKLLPPHDSWTGKIEDESLRAKAPESQIITTAENWEKLWKAWRAADEELPKIDFTRDLVLVATLPGPNRVLIKPWLLDDGNLQIQVMGTKLEGAGFGYTIWRLPREGIRTVEGKELEK